MADLMNPGGGLTKSKLELATAVPGDVVAPATFYAGDKNLKTGTLVERYAITSAVSATLSNNLVYVRFPQGAYRTNSSSGYPEINGNPTLFNSVVRGSSIWQYTQALAYSSGRLSHTASMTVGQVILFVVHGACRDNYEPSLFLDTPNCTNLVNYSSGVYTQDGLYMRNKIIVRVVRVNSNGTATATVTGSGDRAVGFMGAWRLVYN